jgi:Ni,Fe-hydrogenase I large subunit
LVLQNLPFIKVLYETPLIKPSINALYLRDLMHCFEFLQNRLRQFYSITLPDYVKLLNINPIAPQQNYDLRLPEILPTRITMNYLANIVGRIHIKEIRETLEDLGNLKNIENSLMESDEISLCILAKIAPF